MPCGSFFFFVFSPASVKRLKKEEGKERECCASTVMGIEAFVEKGANVRCLGFGVKH